MFHGTRRTSSFLALTLTLAGCTSLAQAPDGSELDYWNPPALAEETGAVPDGRSVVGRMVEFMSSHDDLAAEALLTYEALQESGQKLHFDLLHRIAFRKSEGKLLWQTLRDDGTRDTGWIAAGEFTMVKQPANVFARIQGPVAVPQMVMMLTDEYGIDVPFEDLISGNAADLWLGDEVTSVAYVGEAFIGRHWTDHVAIRKPGLDLEVWVAQGEAPYPAKIAATLTETEELLSFVFLFREFSTVLSSPEALILTIPDDARRVDLAPVVVY